MRRRMRALERQAEKVQQELRAEIERVRRSVKRELVLYEPPSQSLMSRDRACACRSSARTARPARLAAPQRSSATARRAPRRAPSWSAAARAGPPRPSGVAASRSAASARSCSRWRRASASSRLVPAAREAAHGRERQPARRPGSRGWASSTWTMPSLRNSPKSVVAQGHEDLVGARPRRGSGIDSAQEGGLRALAGGGSPARGRRDRAGRRGRPGSRARSPRSGRRSRGRASSARQPVSCSASSGSSLAGAQAQVDGGDVELAWPRPRRGGEHARRSSAARPGRSTPAEDDLRARRARLDRVVGTRSACARSPRALPREGPARVGLVEDLPVVDRGRAWAATSPARRPNSAGSRGAQSGEPSGRCSGQSTASSGEPRMIAEQLHVDGARQLQPCGRAPLQSGRDGCPSRRRSRAAPRRSV